MEEFPSGQRGQTVNLLRFASVVRIHPPPPRRSKVRFAPTSFYACGKKRRHPPASLLLLPKPNPLRWASVWCRRFAAILFHHNKLLIFDLSSCSPQAAYRLRRTFHFITKLIARSFRRGAYYAPGRRLSAAPAKGNTLCAAPHFSNCTRSARLRFGAASRRQAEGFRLRVRMVHTPKKGNRHP